MTQSRSVRPGTGGGSYPDVVLLLQAVGLVLVLLDLPGDLRHFPPLAEVDELLAVALEVVRVALLRLQDVGQVNTWSP